MQDDAAIDSLESKAAKVVADWLYATDYGTRDGSSTLYRLGTTVSNGSVSLEVVGETGVRDIFDIAFMGSRLFGIGPGFGTLVLLHQQRGACGEGTQRLRNQ